MTNANGVSIDVCDISPVCVWLAICLQLYHIEHLSPNVTTRVIWVKIVLNVMITQESTDPVKESPTRVNDVTRMAEKNTTPDITIEPNTDIFLTPKKQSVGALFITTPTHQNAQIKSARNIETPTTDLPIRIRRAIRKRSGSLPSPTSILLPNTGLLFSKTPSASRPPSRPSSRATTPTHVPDHTPISRKRIKKLPSSFLKYLQSELSVEYATDVEETIPESPKQAIDEQVRKNVYNLLHVPLELEKVRFLVA
jgi:hypothetical protein